MSIDFPCISWNDMGADDVAGSAPKPHTDLVFPTTTQKAIKAQKCIAFEEAIVRLIRWAVGDVCGKCGKVVDITTQMLATCLMVKWRCSDDDHHVHGRWSSQPNLLGMKAGNLLVPVCHILAGNSYVKTALFCKFFKLGFVGESNYYR